MAVGVTTTVAVHATSGKWGERKLTTQTERRVDDGRVYDQIDLSADGVRIHLYLDPANTRELYDALGAHLAAQEPAQAA